MARIDKYDPIAGGFRAPLNAAYTGAAAPIGVGLNSSGRVVAGPGVTGIIGVVCCPYDKAAGDIIDVMTNGELTEFGGAAGTIYYAHATTGVISSASSIYRVGQTVEADRLVVRIGAIPPATNVVGDQAAIPDLAASTAAALTDSSGGSANGTIAAITNAANVGSADVGPTADAIADLAAQVNNLVTDVDLIIAKVNTIITTLESAGLVTP